MIVPHDTIPQWKMPDNEKIPRNYKEYIKIDFIYVPSQFVGWGEFVGDLTKYYDWAEEHNIEMEHDILRTGVDLMDKFIVDGSRVYKINPGVRKSKNCGIMFVFWNQDDADKFKRKWKNDIR